MTKQQRLVLTISILAAFVAFLDGAIVNVALPAIQRELGGGLAAQQWVIDAYLLTLGSLILIAGSLSDLLGRRKILTLGLLGFGAASLLCAFAPNVQILIFARALQGIAGALLVPSSLALVIGSFSGPAQAKAIGTWTAWTGISFLLGPLIGGILIDTASWRWIFAINVIPIALTLYLLRSAKIPQKTPSRAPIDLVGAVLCAFGLGGPVFGLIEQSHYGWSSPLIYIPLVVGAGLFLGFLRHEQTTAHPMLPLGLFRNRNFSFGNAATLAIYAGLTTATFLIVLFLQQVAGYSALAAGMSLLPVTLMMFILSPRFGALAGRRGPRLFMSLGPVIAGIGFLLMLRLSTDVSYWTQLFPAIVVFGLGLSMTVAPLTSAILGDIEPAQAGIASAVNNAVARVAGLLAVAVVGAVVSVQFGASLNQHYSPLGSASPLMSAVGQAKQQPLIMTPPKPFTDDQDFHIALNNASVHAFDAGIIATASLVIAGGAISFIGIRNPVRKT